MSTVMFINQLDRMNACYITPDDAQYGKFTCVYSTGESISQFKRHLKSGFDSHAESINWYLSRFPNGNVMSPMDFLSMQEQMLMLTLPKGPNTFDPTYMTERPKPVAVRRTKDGQVVSDFE